MSPLTLRLSAPASPVAEWWTALVLEARGLLIPVPVGEAERYDERLSLSLYEGPALTEQLGRALVAEGRVSAWCAVVVPWPVDGRLVRQPILRMGRPGGLVPLAALGADGSGMTLTFAAAGAPLLPPPSLDRGGPIDQAFADAVFAARREVGEWLARLVARGFGVTVAGAEDEARAGLVAALGEAGLR